jgi:hypothetical protein
LNNHSRSDRYAVPGFNKAEQAWFEVCQTNDEIHAYGETDTDVAAVDNGSSHLGMGV